MKTERVNFYQSIHKTLRRLLFLFSTALGRADFTAEKELNHLTEQFTKLKHKLESHADHEKTYLHPFIREWLPEDCHLLDDSHLVQHQQLLDLERYFSLIANSENFVEKQNLGGKFYLAFNRFLSDYLAHLDQEEAIIMPRLWELCDDEILMKPLLVFFANMSKEEFLLSLPDFLPAISPQERQMMLKSLTLEERRQFECIS